MSRGRGGAGLDNGGERGRGGRGGLVPDWGPLGVQGTCFGGGRRGPPGRGRRGRGGVGKGQKIRPPGRAHRARGSQGCLVMCQRRATPSFPPNRPWSYDLALRRWRSRSRGAAPRQSQGTDGGKRRRGGERRGGRPRRPARPIRQRRERRPAGARLSAQPPLYTRAPPLHEPVRMYPSRAPLHVGACTPPAHPPVCV